MMGALWAETPMQLALQQARTAGIRGDVPVGAVVVGPKNQILAAAGNEIERDADPTAHAEILALRRAAAAIGRPRLIGCDIYVTLEPCPMCAQAIAFARIRRLYFGADDPKGGGVEHGPRIFANASCHHRPEIYGGIAARESGAMLQEFFAQRR